VEPKLASIYFSRYAISAIFYLVIKLEEKSARAKNTVFLILDKFIMMKYIFPVRTDTAPRN